MAYNYYALLHFYKLYKHLSIPVILHFKKNINIQDIKLKIRLKNRLSSIGNHDYDKKNVLTFKVIIYIQ